MTAAHEHNFHYPANHNERVKLLVRKFEISLGRASGERSEIIAREDDGEKLCFADKARASDLYLQVQDLSRTIEQLQQLILPE